MSNKKKEELEQLNQKVTELEAQLKRAVADYHNLEKRVSEGRSELTRWGTGELLVKLLPVLDHLDKALSGAGEADRQSGWFKGVELAVKEFKSVLQSEGLEEVPTEGEFNPALHEALDTAVGDDNKILRVVRKGYTLNGKVLRPAAVVVGRKSESNSGNQELREGEN